MKSGAYNRIQAELKSIKKGDATSLIEFDVARPHEMPSVLTTESVELLRFAAFFLPLQIYLHAFHTKNNLSVIHHLT